MKRYIIIGTGKKAEILYNLLKTNGIEITFVDLFYKEQEKKIYEHKVLDLKKIDFSNYADSNEVSIFIAKDYQFSLNDIYAHLHKCKIKSVSVFDGEKFEVLSFEDKPVIGYIEMHLVNHCNLNCRGCSHMSNVSPVDFIEEDYFEKEIEILNSKFNVQTIRLMGGEPLLHPRISQLVAVTRDILPYSRIELVTNGLLLVKMTDEFWENIRDKDIVVSVSSYKPTMHISDGIIELFERHNIKYIFDVSSKQKDDKNYVFEFHKGLGHKKTHDGNKSSKVCFGKNCYFYKDFKISKCAYPALIHLLNEKFFTSYVVEQDDFIDVRNINDGWDALKKLTEPMDFCSYCIEERPHKFEWTNVGDALLSDYIVEK